MKNLELISMSGEEISKSVWIVLLPMFFLVGILIFIYVVPLITIPGIPTEFNTGIMSGVVQILPELGLGLGIGMIVLIFAIARNRR